METLKFEQKSANGEDEKKKEQELSPEVIEKIMEKVQDIDAEGTAHHVSSDKKLDKLLLSGLLGDDFHGDRNITKEGWLKNARKRRSFLHFNIVGRAKDLYWKDHLDAEEKMRKEIGRSHFFRERTEKIAILFDMQNYQELTPMYYPSAGKGRTVRSHHPYSPSGESINKDKLFIPIEESKGFSKVGKANRDADIMQEHGLTKTGLLKSDSEHGFILSHRVAPRFFRGIVSHQDKKHVDRVIKIMHETYKEKLTSLLPVYDVYGNLYWPKKMGYDDVKKLVAEREEAKKKGGEKEDGN